MPCSDYESTFFLFCLLVELMLTGWRRCGDLLYLQPEYGDTGCTLRTIILPIEKFQTSRSHRRVCPLCSFCFRC